MPHFLRFQLLRSVKAVAPTPPDFAAFNRRLRMMTPDTLKKPLKILMLHGYTQSGQLFHAKTRVLEKHLQKAFPTISLTYATGPIPLKASDMPGFDSSRVAPEDQVDVFGWWRRNDNSNPPEYAGIEKGLETVSKLLESEGPFDGVIGFSQGAALAAMTASLVEGNTRKQAFQNAQAKSSFAIPYPSSFATLGHPPLKFCVPYAGFIAPGERYMAFYDSKITTPVCHFIGSLDSVIGEERTTLLTESCEGCQVVPHPGGHFVPQGKQYLNILVAFIQNTISDQKTQPDRKEESVEDMELPF
jgi:pimeloyl-ACP methyl ester carboxylesterase